MSYEVVCRQQIVAFCKDDDFKTYVRQAISNEMFWRDLLTKLNLSNEIRTELNTQVPNLVRTELDRTMPNLVKSRIIEYLNDNLEKMIAKEMKSQLISYLENSPQMQKILTDHIRDITNILETKVREILAQIIDDPQYHVITSVHLQKMENKCEVQIDNALKKLDSRADESDKKMKQIISALQEKLNKLDNTASEVTHLREKYSKMKKQISILNWGMGGMFILYVSTMLGVITYFRTK